MTGSEFVAEAADPEAQQSPRRAALGLRETSDRVRSNALQSTGAPVIPGC
jgi:hypothetical protein